MKFLKNSKGFTLAELLIVMAVVVVLASVSTPTLGKYIETARETADMEIIRSYYDDTLSLAILDAEDGKLDGIIKGDSGTNVTIQNGTGITNTNGTFVVTLGTVTPKASFKQQKSGWDYVNSSVGGVAVQAAINTNTTITYAYELNSSGEVELKSITPGGGT